MTGQNHFAKHFFGMGEASARTYSDWMRIADDLLSLAQDTSPYSGASPELLNELLDGEVCPRGGVGVQGLRGRLRSS